MRKSSKKALAAVIAATLLLSGATYGAPARQALAAEEAETIVYQDKTIVLSESALYVDQTLTENGTYKFKSLQEAVAAAQAGTKENPTVIYLAPDVYWTDDYTKEEVREKDDLIGLVISQPYITLVGLTGNPEDVVIASDRGQNAGANGNFNTIGVGDGFHAKDLTIGNYCNIDLVYELDSTKNHTKRQESITQAQAVTKAPDVAEMDEWLFENCNIVSRLNLFSRDDRPNRSLLVDCHLECTDDSLGTGYISIFVNCDIELYSNTPCGGASHYMQAFLGCDFITDLSDNKTLTFCKNTKPFAFIDCEFVGDMTGMEWKQGNLSDDLRQIVYNNTLNGQPLEISPSKPELSVTPDEEQLKAFKIGDTYNVYNLLNGAGYEEWDPLGQKETMSTSAWNIQFDYVGKEKDVVPVIEGNETDSLEVTPIVLGGEAKSVVWSTDDAAVTLETLENGNVLVKAKNETVESKIVSITATAANGMEKVLHLSVSPTIVAAPTVMGDITLTKTADGKVTATYELTGDASVTENSYVNWYRATKADGSDKSIVAQTTYVTEGAVPYTGYTLKPADVGYYIVCEVVPQRVNSEPGTSVFAVTSEKILSTDVDAALADKYEVDLEHLAYVAAVNDTAENYYEWTNELVSGTWYGGFYLPEEYREGGVWADKKYKMAEGELPYTFANGASGAAGTVGLQTTTQGARLVYADDTTCGGMKLTLTMSPHKTAAQGFGSAKQFMDIFIKYDAATMTGYGLRIARMPEITEEALKDYAAKSCTFTLMEYKNGVATPLEEGVVSTAFLPGCTVVLEVKDNVITADVTTASAQDSAYPEAMPHEVHISHIIGDKVNLYSGFGLQHTGTAGEGKSGNRTTIHSLKVEYTRAVEENPAVEEPKVTVTHTVVRGDTMWDIAEKYLGAGNRYKEIMELNHMESEMLYVDMVLNIPGMLHENGYIVRRNDTLWMIAEKLLGDGSRYPEIKKLSGLTDDMIYPGQELVIPEK